MYNISPNTLFIGRKVHFFQECFSTNEVAQQLVYKNKAIEGSVVVCQHQTAGKGQQGNTWESQPGENLTFSVILSPKFLQADQQFRLNMAVSLALFDTLKYYKVSNVRIKWPNDLMIGDFKTAGILIENSLSGREIKQSVIGVGLNVNQEYFSLPKATSMKKQTGTHFDLEILLSDFMEKLEPYYLGLKSTSGSTGKLELSYLSALYGMNETKHFQDEKGVFMGEIIGLTAQGKLKVHRVGGAIESYGFKEIVFL